MDDSRLSSINYPDLYILDTDREKAMVELTKALNKDLEKKVSEGRLKAVREALASIVNEALTPGQEKNINSLPETIEILIGRYGKDHTAMGLLTKLGSNSSVLVEHTVNVTALTLQFCFFHKLSDADTQQLSMAALLHDIGCTKIITKLIETPNRLTDKQYKTYITHPELGHEIITENTNFDIAIPIVALEHHERLDGSGYPKGLNRISSYSQLIGLIDSYESLTYRSKLFRKKKKPYDSLNVIKDETYKKKFAKGIFKRFTACLTK
ncbi:MAG: HD domain-containing protein [Desulfobacteraceae bacterium]|nr:HD domain-containing protein [Desulfobacteraceae bacterium]